MRFPNESLDEYKARQAKIPDPPEPVTLEFTGETEVLKPLAYWEGPVKDESLIGTVFHHLSWFHRSLAMAGALTVVTFLLGTGLYFLVYGPPVDRDTDTPDLAWVQQSDDTLTSTDELSSPNDLVSENPPSAVDETDAVTSVQARRPIRARAFRAAYRPRRTVQRSLSEWLHPQLWISQFVPTNQLIYIENGVVKTRIEPRASTK